MGVGTELWLVRYGETEWSLSGAHTSRTDIPLTERGRQQARNLRLALDNILFDVVFVSPRLRAHYSVHRILGTANTGELLSS
jgi:broad specificity phosphatase PhoE